MNKEKGDKYEIYVRDYIINNLNKQAYLWSHIPDEILIEAGLIHSNNEHRLIRKMKKEKINNPLIDTGIDILQKDEDNFTLIQCKNGYINGLTIKDLTGFYMMMANHVNLNGTVYHTSKISRNILENNTRFKYIKLEYNDGEIDTNLEIIKDKIKNKKNIKVNLETILNRLNEDDINKKYKAYDYQLDASLKIINYLKENNKGILTIPCGCGKTFISYLVSQEYKKIVLISPLKQFAKQNLDKFIEYGNVSETLLIDSDGTRDINKINNLIKKENYLLSVTYKSVDTLSVICEANDVLIIIDEFHNLSKNNVSNILDPFYKLLLSNNKFLLMSATPRIYELENETEIDNEENIYEENIDLGKIIYKMTFADAIKNKYIADYKIYLPSISENNDLLINDIVNELNDEFGDEECRNKCIFLFKCLVEKGSRKCIIYCENIDKIITMLDIIKKLNKYYFLDIEYDYIIGTTKFKKRNSILESFNNSTKVFMLFSVRILDECIDIQDCDSIYITYPSQSEIRTIQRMSRCLRINKNKFKTGNIFIWCTKYDDILNTLSGIEDYDIMFKTKINILVNNFNGKRDEIIKNKNDVDTLEKIINIKEYKKIKWIERLEELKTFIDKYDKLPSSKSNRSLSFWTHCQKKIYQENKFLNEDMKILWEDFMKQYNIIFRFKTRTKIDFNEMFDKIKKYIDEKKIRPTPSHKNKEISEMGRWYAMHQQYYNNKVFCMKNIEIYNKWTGFIEEYKTFLKNNIEIWFDNLKKVESYINKNKKKPSEKIGPKSEIELGVWIRIQQTNYIIKKHIMKNTEIYNSWTNFLNNFKLYFRTSDQIWSDNLHNLDIFISTNYQRPKQNSKCDDEKKLAVWLNTQLTNFRKNHDLLNDHAKKPFIDFIKKYKIYFKHEYNICIDNNLFNTNT